MEEEKENKKGKATRKEILMVIVVVVLAFGLTVAGIVYLTNFLIGGDKPQPKPAVTQPSIPEDDNVIRFTDTNQQGTQEQTAQAAPTTPTTTEPATPAPADPQPQSVQPAAPTGTTAPEVAVAPVIPSVTTPKGDYQLQLFAFRSKEKAETEAAKYKTDCPDIYVIRADLGADGIWYRVRGCAGTKNELAGKKTEIEKKYNISPYIVKVQ